MYLKTLEIHGFKSFANKLKFEFHNGITAIVGPNGSGKSNVADAVRWVLGEQSAKQLRGSNMQDVIFSGSEMRKPMAYAHVSMIFDNADHYFPLDYEEIAVTRRVYRSGESEYLMNGSPCRLKDVQELFMDTGIGKEGYSIIGQGQIEQILSTRPENVRELFDEAAGIVKLKKRKALTEKNLEEERGNLSRVADILDEIEKQRNSVEKQAEKARVYLQYREELKRLEVSQFLFEYKENDQEKRRFEQNFLIAKNDLEQTETAYSQAKESYDTLEKALQQETENFEEEQKKKSELELFIQKTEGKISLLQEQIFASIQNEKRLEQQQIVVQDMFSEKQKEWNQLSLEENIQSQELTKFLVLRNAIQQELQVIQEKIGSLQQEMDQCNTFLLKLAEESGAIKSKLERLEVMEEQNTVKKLENNRKILDWKREEELLETSLKEKEKEQCLAEESVEKIRKKEEELNKNLLESRELDQKLKLSYQIQQRKYLQQKSRLDSFLNIAERYDGYGNSIRKIMEKRRDIPGVLGVVADLIKVEKKYETAIETALGGSIQHIVTDGEETAKELIRYLKENKYGRATFLPLASIGAGRAPLKETFEKEIGFLGMASSLVQAEKQYDGLVCSLLGHILVMDQMDHALTLAKTHGYRLRIVTLDGEQLSPGGSISGGAYKNSSNLLARKREIEELEQEVQNLFLKTEEIQKEQEAEQQKRGKIRLALETCGHDLQEKYVVQTTIRMELSQEKEKQNRMQDTYSKMEREIKELHEQRKSIQVQREGFFASFQENENRKKELENRIAEIVKELEEEKLAEQEKGEEETKLRVETSNSEQKKKFIGEQLLRIRQEQERFFVEKQELSSSFLQCQKERTFREEEEMLLKERQEKQKQELKILIRRLEERVKQREGLREAYKVALEQREAFSMRKNDLDKEVFRLSARLDKLLEQFNSSTAYLWEEYALTLTTAREFFGTQVPEKNNIKKITEQKLKLKQLGDVHVGAIEEYRTLSERFLFLTEQKTDLEKAEATLRELILDLEEEMRKQFLEQFAAIKKEFNQVFQALFGGGKAELLLLEEEDILTAGIKIIAQPPGKKLQNMMQLSGGEKALTAISLLFAIQNLKPSPFCLLDEIEAALDDANVKRFAKYLTKLSKASQFIVITHRRGTMAFADILYGVTMQEKGVSALVSVSLLEEELK